jgi:ribosomal protein RSM22 (predicted rRNA methylase)
MCTPTGTLERVVVAKGASKPLPGKYMAARKAQWGGLWPFPDV